MRKSFLIYKDSLKVLDKLNDTQIAQLFKTIKAYQLDEPMPQADFAMTMVFEPFLQYFERDNVAYKEKCEKNQKSAGVRWHANACERMQTMRTDANDADTDTDTEADAVVDKVTSIKVNASACEFKSTKHVHSENPAYAEIINDLNSVCGTSYKPTTPKTIELIKARLKEGFTKEDFLTVHKNMHASWSLDTKMREFLRPQTLYSNKFESYLNKIAHTELDRYSDAGKHTLMVGMNWLKNREAQKAENNA